MLFMELAARNELLREFGTVSDWVWSETEQIRLDACKSDIQRQRLMAGHGLARRLLCRCLGGDVTDWCLNGAAGEPPTVVDHPELHLSIAHSNEWFACALSDAPVGIDIEVLKPQRDVLAMAEIVANEEEWVQIIKLNEDEQGLYFVQIWTLKEAWLKQQGYGLDFDLMRKLSATMAKKSAANAISWVDREAGLAMALTSNKLDWLETNWPDTLRLYEPTCWQLEPPLA